VPPQFQLYLFSKDSIWLAHHNKKVKLSRLPKIDFYLERWSASPFWPTYLGEKGRTLGKIYGSNGGTIGNTLRVHIGNLNGTCWEQRRNGKKIVPHVHLRSALEHVQEYEFSRLPPTYFQRQQQKVQKKNQPKTFISCSAVVRHTTNTKLQLSARKSRIHDIACTLAIVIAQPKLSSFSEKSLVNDFQISSDPGR